MRLRMISRTARHLTMLAALGAGLASEASAKPTNARDIPAVRRFLQSEEPRDARDSPARFWASSLPGTGLLLVYIQSSGDCGTGGCTLMILRPRGASFHVESWYPATLRPVTILPTAHFGRPDIGIRCRCEATRGGWKSYQIPLRFNGWRYRRFTDAPLADGGGDRGKVLIGKQESGFPLF